MLIRTDIPFRQKLLISLTITVGLGLLFVNQFRLIDRDILKYIIWMYPIIVSSWILWGEELIDLNNKKIFSIWLIIGIFYFIFYLLFHLHSFKTLLIFLLAYWLLNFIKKKFIGTCLLNTSFQMSWKHVETKKQITWLDVFFNIILYVVILVSWLTK